MRWILSFLYVFTLVGSHLSWWLWCLSPLTRWTVLWQITGSDNDLISSIRLWLLKIRTCETPQLLPQTARQHLQPLWRTYSLIEMLIHILLEISGLSSFSTPPLAAACQCVGFVGLRLFVYVKRRSLAQSSSRDNIVTKQHLKWSWRTHNLF